MARRHGLRIGKIRCKKDILSEFLIEEVSRSGIAKKQVIVGNESGPFHQADFPSIGSSCRSGRV
jgi:hypothetical protein